MGRWTLDDIPWHEFDASKVKPEMVSLLKAACMVEHNSADYVRYLREVFHDDAEFQAVAQEWADEELQHGQSLRKWTELADPGFNFDESFRIFTTGFSLPQNVSGSVRGSRCGELIARCVVETGTSAYYTAIKDCTEEPVLKALCAKIAADEFRHYKLFYGYLEKYSDTEKMTMLKRLKIALGRLVESGDDELAYAFYAAHCTGLPYGNGVYERKAYKKAYFSHATRIYLPRHIERMVAMVFKAVGLKTNTRLQGIANWAAWRALQLQARGV